MNGNTIKERIRALEVKVNIILWLLGIVVARIIIPLILPKIANNLTAMGF